VLEAPSDARMEQGQVHLDVHGVIGEDSCSYRRQIIMQNVIKGIRKRFINSIKK
jgi:hypothetical protein